MKLILILLLVLVAGCVSTGEFIGNDETYNASNTSNLNETTTTVTTTSITTTTAMVLLQAETVNETKKADIVNVTIDYIDYRNETVKICNKGDDVNLSGWTLSDKANHTYSFLLTLLSNASLILHTGNGTDNATDVYWGYKASVWNDDGDTASLRNSSGDKICEYSYVPTTTTTTSTTTSTTTTTVTTSTTTTTESTTTSSTTSSSTTSTTETTTTTTTTESTTTSSTTTSTTTTIQQVDVVIAFIDYINETVRLENRADTVDMTNWTIRDLVNHTYIFSINLMPNESVILHTFTGQDNETDIFWGRSQDVWNNEGDSAFLRDANENLIYLYNYTP